jgi:hypothetical protein
MLKPISTPSSSTSFSLSKQLANIALKQQILLSLCKLADHDTHQVALEDLHSITQSLPPYAVPVLLNSLYQSSSDPTNKPIIKRVSLHLLSLYCQCHHDLKLPRLTKIISHIIKRLRDSDSSVRTACCDAIGVLSGSYLKDRVGLFTEPLFDAMRAPNKGVQLGAAMCMVKMVECTQLDSILVGEFQKLCPRISRLLNCKNFLAKADLLGVVKSLSQVWAMSSSYLYVFEMYNVFFW